MPDLPAGPELDRLIAEKVMGWKWDAGQNWYAGSSGAGTSPRTGFWPSSNIAHAWEVLGKMECPQLTRIESDSIPDGEGGEIAIHQCWRCSCETFREGASVAVEADTAPHAICLTALAALAG